MKERFTKALDAVSKNESRLTPQEADILRRHIIASYFQNIVDEKIRDFFEKTGSNYSR